ncbi:septation ring formation regulator EzrA [Lacticaseibacillus saniviri]
MIGWIVGLVVILVIAGGVLGYRMYLKSQLTAQISQYQALVTTTIDEQIKQIGVLNLSGTSLKDFTKWQRTYQQLMETNYQTIKTHLADASEALQRFRFGTVKQNLADSADELTTLTPKLEDIQTRFEQILGTETSNRNQLAEVITQFQEDRKQILAKGFRYGDGLPALEEQAQTINESIGLIEEQNEAGDYKAAKQALAETKDAVDQLSASVEYLPPLVNELLNEFPGQIDEINRGFEQLQQQQYQFPAPAIPERIDMIQTNLENAHQQLVAADLPAMKATNEETAEMIDQIYATLETEMEAKPKVLERQDDLRQFLAHALTQNQRLLRELDHLNQSYTLSHDEMKSGQALEKQLSEIDTEYHQLADRLAAQDVIYSEVLAKFEQWQGDLTAIEKQQVDINTAVAGLKDGEIEANHQQQAFEQVIRDLRRQLEAHELPGLDDAYQDYYQMVAREVNDLGTDLSQVKIDMDAINRQLIQIQTDLDELTGKTQAVIDAAGLTESLMQYANRYKLSRPEVASALTSAQKQYGQFHYQAAADELATALEQVEPGSYQKVETAYLSQKQNALF